MEFLLIYYLKFLQNMCFNNSKFLYSFHDLSIFSRNCKLIIISSFEFLSLYYQLKIVFIQKYSSFCHHFLCNSFLVLLISGSLYPRRHVLCLSYSLFQEHKMIDCLTILQSIYTSTVVMILTIYNIFPFFFF